MGHLLRTTEMQILVFHLHDSDPLKNVLFSVPVVPPFSPLLTPIPSPPLPSQSSPIVCAYESCICVPLLSLSLSFPHLPSFPYSHCQFVLFKSLVLFFSFVCFVDYIPLIGEIMWYLYFTACFISLSIILSSSIHAVTKGRCHWDKSKFWPGGCSQFGYYFLI